jgi:hypothetical protein
MMIARLAILLWDKFPLWYHLTYNSGPLMLRTQVRYIC